MVLKQIGWVGRNWIEDQNEKKEEEPDRSSGTSFYLIPSLPHPRSSFKSNRFGTASMGCGDFQYVAQFNGMNSFELKLILSS